MLTLYRVCVRRNSIKRVLGGTWAHTLSPLTERVQEKGWISMMVICCNCGSQWTSIALERD